MSYNEFGRHFRLLTFGESHGPAVGVVIDGVPPGLRLDLAAVQRQLDRRRPGQSELSSPRVEQDRVECLSGLLRGVTTSAPLCLLVHNRDARPRAYAQLRDLFRPGHADLTWWLKYGLRDWRGGGRASGRETVARVAAGAVARQLLATPPLQLRIVGHVVEVAGVRAQRFDAAAIERNPVRCADPEAAVAMAAAIRGARDEGDSVGGVVEVRATGVPPGLGDPVFGKLDALLAGALMGIGAVKGVEIGAGFAAARLRGSQCNDEMIANDEMVDDDDLAAVGPPSDQMAPLGPLRFPAPPGAPQQATNRAGGVLGGISTGAEVVARLAVKPTPSIRRPQRTVDTSGRPATLELTDGRHDPCIAPRLVPVAEAMVALVLIDLLMAQRMLAAIAPTHRLEPGAPSDD